MPLPPFPIRTLRAAAPAFLLACAALRPAADGAIVVYDGFNYGGSNGALNGKSGGGELGLAGSWLNNGEAGTSNYLATGLTFSDIPVFGGMAELANSTGNITGAVRPIGVDAAGTLWGSYLFRTVLDTSSAGNSLSAILMGPTQTMNDQTSWFDIEANQFSNALGAVHVAGERATFFGNAPTVGVTHLLAFKLENLGFAGNQTASAWMLTAGQYDNFKPGGITESELNSAATGTGNSQVLGRITKTVNPAEVGRGTGTFTSSDFLRLFNYNNVTTDFDEIKISNGSLNEAITVPEPSAGALVLVGLLLGMRRYGTRNAFPE